MKPILAKHPRIAVAGLVGLVLFAGLYPLAFMRDARPMPLSRDAVTGRALDFAALEGWTDPQRFAQTVPIEGDDWKAVRTAAAAAGESVPDRESLPDPAWETSIVSSPRSIRTAVTTFTLPDPILLLELTPDGSVVSYIELSSPIAGGNIDGPQAQRLPPYSELNGDRLFDASEDDRRNPTREEQEWALATTQAFLARHDLPQVGEPESVAVRDVSRKPRLTYLRWSRPGPAGTVERTRVILWGDRVAGYDRDLRDPASPLLPERFNLVVQIVESIPLLGMLLGGALVGALLLLRRRQGELDLRSAAVLYAFIVLSSVASIAMMFGAFCSMLGNLAGTVGIWTGLINVVITTPIVTLLIAFVIAGAWAVGESQSYLVWPQHHIRPFSAWMRGDFRTTEAAEPVAVGYLSAFAALGATTLVGLASPAADASSVAHLFALNSWPSMVSPLLGGLLSGLSMTVVAGIFAMTYVRLRTKRMWIVLIAGFLAALSIRAGFSLSQFFPGTPIVSLVVYLVLAGGVVVLFVRSGPLASFTAIFAYIVVANAYPVVLTGQPQHVALGCWALVASLGVAALAGYGVWRPRPQGTSASVPSHVRRAIERLRLDQEFDVARGVQAQLLPAHAPRMDGFDVAGVCVPANEVGGDYFDYFTLDRNRVGIAIGDVSGKGVGAAIYMTLTKSYMVTQSRETEDPARVLARVNTHLRRNLARGTFVTMAYAILDADRRTVAYARAGHNPILLVRTDGDGDFLNAPGVTLGAVASTTLETIMRVETIDLRPGDLLLLYTDGVTEAMNTRSDEYGDERLIAFARSIARTRATAREVVDALLRDVRTFAGRAAQHDDITVVAVRVM